MQDPFYIVKEYELPLSPFANQDNLTDTIKKKLRQGGATVNKWRQHALQSLEGAVTNCEHGARRRIFVDEQGVAGGDKEHRMGPARSGGNNSYPSFVFSISGR